jgi:hypothetical protein
MTEEQIDNQIRLMELEIEHRKRVLGDLRFIGIALAVSVILAIIGMVMRTNF